jgi:hypothetical protein
MVVVPYPMTHRRERHGGTGFGSMSVGVRTLCCQRAGGDDARYER